MLRAALALLSTVQVGARIKESLDRSLRQAAIAAVALVFLLGAAAFGLIAAYHFLIAFYQFSAGEAAAIMAASLLLVGLIVLALASRAGSRPKRQAPARVAPTAEGPGMLDEGIGRVVQQVGPVPLLAIAFLAGILATRRRR